MGVPSFDDFKKLFKTGAQTATGTSGTTKTPEQIAAKKKKDEGARAEVGRRGTLKAKRKRELEAGGTLGQLLLNDEAKKEERALLLTSTDTKPSLLG